MRTQQRHRIELSSIFALMHSLRSGVTAYSELSPVNGSFATVATQGVNPEQLDASTAASGPHDFAVRFMRVRLLRNPRPPHPTARS